LASKELFWQAGAFFRLANSTGAEGYSVRRVLMLPALIAGTMLIIGFTAAGMAGFDGTGLTAPYLVAIFKITCLSLLVYIFIAFVRLARSAADNPINRVLADLRTKAPLLLLPAFIFPLFLVGYTNAKTAIPFLIGYGWEAIWADADKLIFGQDTWRLAHQLMGTKYINLWDSLYSIIWAACLLLYKANVTLYAKPRNVGVIYTAMLMTWLVGGWFMAYLMSAAGPVFAHLFDPAFAGRFAPLRSTLDATLGEHSATRIAQSYLSKSIDLHMAIKGGGISAMPSMHVGAVTIYVVSARGTRWLVPAILFWIYIFLASAYFGYHYWVDGIVAALVAWGCWKFAQACFPVRQETIGPIAPNTH
jgi:hypothetical protein